jgi:hypothetical protein
VELVGNYDRNHINQCKHMTYQVHVRSPQHTVVQHWDDAGCDNISRPTDITRKDVERVKLGGKVELLTRVSLRHCGKLKGGKLINGSYEAGPLYNCVKKCLK